MIRVDLPAPFAPISPITPGSTSTVSSETAVTWPYFLVSESVEISGGEVSGTAASLRTAHVLAAALVAVPDGRLSLRAPPSAATDSSLA